MQSAADGFIGQMEVSGAVRIRPVVATLHGQAPKGGSANNMRGWIY